MPTRVISAGGVPTTVANMGDVEGGAYVLPAATTNDLGGVKKGATVADCTVAADGTSAGTQLNALIASLKAAGVIA
ncbi:MAG: head fiber protein [Hafnia sp.]